SRSTLASAVPFCRRCLGRSRSKTPYSSGLSSTSAKKGKGSEATHPSRDGALCQWHFVWPEVACTAAPVRLKALVTLLEGCFSPASGATETKALFKDCSLESLGPISRSSNVGPTFLLLPW